MTSLLEPIVGNSATNTKDANHNKRHSHCRNVLRYKTIHKHKCKQVLKKKLKKYKLRQDGIEDQDIIDVSDTFVSSLFIRSPNKQIDCVEQELDELSPKNYLFRRMVRRKQTTIITKTSNTSVFEVKSHDNNDTSHKHPYREEKKQTNAFKLLMDSRNKSLGTNSPGKEKPLDETEVQEILEKNNIKAKRNLLLQKMAESKGSIKKKVIEEQQEQYIKMKMEKRAEKLKSMIINKELKTDKKNKCVSNLSSPKPRSPLDSIDTEKNEKVFDKPNKTLQLVSIFSETIDTIPDSPEKTHIPNEDEEFLKKLSPSIRKKESMLSYFRKVEKDTDSILADSENDNVVIKVKLGLKPKKKGRKKKLSLKRCTVSDIEKNEMIVDDDKPDNREIQGNQNLVESDLNNSKQKRKRKRDVTETIPNDKCNLIYNESSQTEDVRPKRTVKKPVKYNEDFCCSSSDEELHIFTPKKKKHIEQKLSSTAKPISDTNLNKTNQEESKHRKSASNCINSETLDIGKKNDSTAKPISNLDQDKSKHKKSASCISTETIRRKPKESVNLKKSLKLAPIFTSKPDPAAIEAKQKFLQSGVPEKLKKVLSKQKDNNNQGNDFQKVVHIQQLTITSVEHPPFIVKENEFVGEINLPISKDNKMFTKMLNLSTSQSPLSLQSKSIVETQTILQNFKQTYPRFPVYRTYRLLRSKKKGEFRDSNIFSNMDNSIEILNCSIDMQNDNPDQLTWCDKYKCMSGNEIIGNFDSIKELQKWLVTWTENATKSKVANDSDSSDYYQSDADSRDSIKSNNNLLILSGPVGSGKTSSVYAVAAQLCIKVIEVNASSKRTGKIMLQDLQEATQSHKVNRSTGSAENSQKSEEIIEIDPAKVCKRGRPKKFVEQPTPKKEKGKKKNVLTNGHTASQDITRTAMSLILIDDADIVFEQDDGFCSAVMLLVQSSKRPVILITKSLSCSHLQRFVQSGKILKMQRLLPNILGTWLDIMCLADSGTCWPGLGAKILNFCKGDIRKTINYLQFYVCSQEQVLSIDGNTQTDSQNNEIKINADDESSSMSWVDSHEEKNINTHDVLDSHWFYNKVMNEHMYLNQLRYANGIFNVWWSLPKILKFSDYGLNQGKLLDNVEAYDNKTSLESICNVLDAISVSDYFSHSRLETEPNITSHPWNYSECDSVSELENLDSYNRKFEINNEISYELVKGSICLTQDKLGLNNSKRDLDFPGMTVKRQRERIVSRHINLTTSLSPQSSLDRKALALDYWSFCRSVCRIEKSKTDTNSKRNNRYCHYLKSLSASCKSDSFDKLANSLNPQNNI